MDETLEWLEQNRLNEVRLYDEKMDELRSKFDKMVAEAWKKVPPQPPADIKQNETWESKPTSSVDFD